MFLNVAFAFTPRDLRLVADGIVALGEALLRAIVAAFAAAARLMARRPTALAPAFADGRGGAPMIFPVASIAAFAARPRCAARAPLVCAWLKDGETGALRLRWRRLPAPDDPSPAGAGLP